MAQFGRALRSGRRSRVFESRHSDLMESLKRVLFFVQINYDKGSGKNCCLCRILLGIQLTKNGNRGIILENEMSGRQKK